MEEESTIGTRERISMVLNLPFENLNQSFLNVLVTHCRIFLNEISDDRGGLQLRLRNIPIFDPWKVQSQQFQPPPSYVPDTGLQIWYGGEPEEDKSRGRRKPKKAEHHVLTFSWDKILPQMKEKKQDSQGVEMISIIPKIIRNRNPLQKYEQYKSKYKSTGDLIYIVADTGIYTVDFASPEERRQLYDSNSTLESLVEFEPTPEGIAWKLRFLNCESDFDYYGDVAEAFSTDALTFVTKKEKALCMALYREGFSLKHILSMKDEPSVYTRTFFAGNTVDRKKDYTSGKVRTALTGNTFQNIRISELLNLYSYLFSDDTINKLNELPNFDDMNVVLDILNSDQQHAGNNTFSKIYNLFIPLLQVRKTIEEICRITNPYPQINCLCAVKIGVPLDSDPEELFKNLTDQEKMWYLLNSEHRGIVQIFDLNSYSDVLRMTGILVHFLKNNSLDDLKEVEQRNIPDDQKQMNLVTRNSPIKDCVKFLRKYVVTFKEKFEVEDVPVIAHILLPPLIPLEGGEHTSPKKVVEYRIVINANTFIEGIIQIQKKYRKHANLKVNLSAKLKPCEKKF